MQTDLATEPQRKGDSGRKKEAEMKVLTTTLISALAVIVLAPAAGAATRPDDRGGLRGPGGVAQAELWMDPAIQDARTGVVRPDDRAGRREVPLSVVEPTPVGVSDSFDWSDAGIGAGAVAGTGLFAILLAGLLLGRQDRRRLEHA